MISVTIKNNKKVYTTAIDDSKLENKIDPKNLDPKILKRLASEFGVAIEDIIRIKIL